MVDGSKQELSGSPAVGKWGLSKSLTTGTQSRTKQ